MIKGLYALEPTHKFADERGTITELFSDYPIKAVTHTISKPGVLRGVHIQGWDRIVYPATGRALCLFVDCRKYSATYGQVKKFFCDNSWRRAFSIPAGVGNYYCVLGSKPVDYFYFNLEEFDASKSFTISYKPYGCPIPNPTTSADDENNRLTIHDLKYFNEPTQ